MINLAPNTTAAGLTDLSYDSPVLLTDRLVLRPPHRDDVPELTAIANNRQIAEMTSRMPYPYNLADAETFIEGCVQGKHEGYIYAVTLADTGVHLVLVAVGYMPGRTAPIMDSAVPVADAVAERLRSEGFLEEALAVLTLAGEHLDQMPKTRRIFQWQRVADIAEGRQAKQA